jgi:crotonobetainyl-CoA:carnitine CoA-transferase CaiB-like acyl-CoA transferase
MSRSALAGIRVVDLAQGVGASYCGKLLACFGADVVKVEPPGGGRDRAPGPGDGEWNAAFLFLNTGKRSSVIDATAAQGRQALEELLTGADIVLTDEGSQAVLGERFGAMRLHDDYPGLIHADVSAFGPGGPYAGWAATPLTVYALGGYMYLTGDEDREPLQGPGPQPGYMAGAQAFAGVLLALLARADGHGQRIDVSELEALACAHQWTVARYSYSGMIQRRIGNRYDSGHPITLYRCKGGYVSVGASNDEQAGRLAQLVGLPDLVTDERFATSISRLVNADAYDEIIQPWMDERTKDEITDVCQEWRIPCAPVSTLQDILHHPQLDYRKFWQRLDGPGGTRLIYPGPPFGMSETPGRIEPPPDLGDSPAPIVRWGERRARPTSHDDDAEKKLPLEGVRVVDFARVWSGPLATRMLADFGAEVIRIERPIAPGARQISPEQAKRSGFYPGNDPGEQPWNRNAFLNLFARNKRSIAVDLSKEEGRDVVRQLIAQSDVVAENFSPRVMANLGLDYRRLKELKRDIIMLSMPGYGMDGPYRDRVAYGTTLEPEAGFSAMMGYADRGPQRLGVAYPDPVAGIHGAAAVLLALYHRRQTGEGQYIELAQLETACSFIGDALLRYQLTGELPQPQGNAHPAYAPHGCYPCAGDDRWVTIAVRSDAEWQRLVAEMDRPDIARDHGFATTEGRIARGAEEDALVADWTRIHEMKDVMRRLQAVGIAAGSVSDARDIAEDEHLRARGFYVELEHPEAGRHFYPGQAIRLSATPAVFRSDAPRLGGDTRAVVRSLLGVPEAEYQSLLASGAIAEATPLAVGETR